MYIVTPYFTSEAIRNFVIEMGDKIGDRVKFVTSNDWDRYLFNYNKRHRATILPLHISKIINTDVLVNFVPSLHAKLYIARMDDGVTRIIAGSTNATRMANYNIEYLFKFDNSKVLYLVERLCDSSSPQSEYRNREIDLLAAHIAYLRDKQIKEHLTAKEEDDFNELEEMEASLYGF